MIRQPFTAAMAAALMASSAAAFEPPDQWNIVVEPPPPTWRYNIDPEGVTAFQGILEYDPERLEGNPQFDPHPNFTSTDVSDLGGGLLEITGFVEDEDNPELAVSGTVFSVTFIPLDTPRGLPRGTDALR